MPTPELELRWIEGRLAPWTAWDHRDGIADSDCPGVYVLAHFATAPQTVDPLCSEVVYIGETHKHGRSLRDRWWEFDRSAFSGKELHAGGITYRAEFGPAQKPNLYVSALPVALDKPWYSAFIVAAERLLIWQYALRHQRLPRCNKG